MNSCVLVAKIIAASGRERTTIGTLLGSLHYMGPEQAKGLTVDHRTEHRGHTIVAKTRS